MRYLAQTSQQRQRTDLWTQGLMEGEGRMYGESNMETYTTTYKIDSQWEFAVWEGISTGRGHMYTYG